MFDLTRKTSRTGTGGGACRSGKKIVSRTIGRLTT